MSDITQAVVQDEIASSLMDAPVVGSWMDGEIADHGAEEAPTEIAEQPESDGRLSENDVEQLAGQVARPGESLQREGQQSQNQPEQNQPQEATPQQIQESIQALDAVVEQHQLDDPALASEFAEGFCQAFNVDPLVAGVDVKALGHTMSKVAFSAAQIYDATGGDPSKIGAIQPQMAQAFSSEFLRSWGVDPRQVQVDSQQLASTVLGGVMNFFDTYQKLGGKVTNLEQLNSPEASEYFLTSFLKAFGVETPVDRGMALRFADACGKYLIGFLGKVQQVQPQASRGRGQASRSSASRARGKFRTNNDLYDPETLDAVANERMPRNDDAEFAAKPRAQRSRFTSNSDLFDEDTLSLLNTRL
jgi:hypothetical protein